MPQNEHSLIVSISLQARKTAPSPVETRTGESSTSQTPGSGKYSMSRLNDDQRRSYDAYVRKAKIMTHDQYFKKLEEIDSLQ